MLPILPVNFRSPLVLTIHLEGTCVSGLVCKNIEDKMHYISKSMTVTKVLNSGIKGHKKSLTLLLFDRHIWFAIVLVVTLSCLIPFLRYCQLFSQIKRGDLNTFL